MSKVGNLEITGPEGYEKTMWPVLRSIADNPVGQVVLSALYDLDEKDWKIVPFDKGKAAVYGHCNAGVAADNPRDAAPNGVRGGQKGAPRYIGREDNPRTREDERYDQHPWKDGAGTGDGSDVTVYYTPGKSDGSSCGGGAFGSMPDEVLLHELVHALRKMQGQANPHPTEDTLRGYDNEEEFLAIVVANVYISAKGKFHNTRLRADHHGHQRLKPPLDTSAGFLTDPGNLRLMRIYQGIWTPTFQEVGRAGWPVRPEFNPFRELMR